MFRIVMLAGLVLACGVIALAPARAEDKPRDKAKDKAKVNPAAVPMPRIDFWWARHKKFLEQTKAGGIEVAFLGDSITHGWEGQPDIWKKAFGKFKPGNYGIGGDQTSHVLWRITEGKELDGLKLKAAVIMIGTNNIGGHTAEQIAGGIEAIVNALKEKQPDAKILVLGVFPRAGGIGPKDKVAPKEKLNKKVPEINAIISKLADNKTVFYKDIGDKFLDSEGGLPRETMPDLLHLSKKGYQIWADAIKDDLEKLTQ